MQNVCGVILSASSTRKVHFVGDHIQDGLPVVAEAMMDCETSGWLKVTAVCVDATETRIKKSLKSVIILLTNYCVFLQNSENFSWNFVEAVFSMRIAFAVLHRTHLKTYNNIIRKCVT